MDLDGACAQACLNLEELLTFLSAILSELRVRAIFLSRSKTQFRNVAVELTSVESTASAEKPGTHAGKVGKVPKASVPDVHKSIVHE
jgi:hypothetical protein